MGVRIKPDPNKFMKLLIIRHGIAEDSSKNGDEARVLTDEGIEKLKKVGKFLGDRLKENSVILYASPYIRAQQTADVISSYISPNERFACEHLIPDGSIEDSFKEVTSKDCDLCICVGHQPHLGSFVSYAVTGNYQPVVNVTRGCSVLIEFNSSVRKGGGIIRFVVSPKIIN